jgi:hypothetical protein
VKSFRKSGDGRKYDFNQGYFASIDTPEQAYWLGFLAADGFVIDTNRGIGLGLGVKDVAHLELFRSTLDADDVPFSRATSGYEGSGEVRTLRLHSMRLARDASRYGIVPNKTTFCKPWDAPPELAPHYWRGLIDGDGHVGKRACGYLAFCGTEAMCNGFIDFAKSICGTNARPLQVKNLWQISVNGRHQVALMLEALYANDEVALPRKKAQALEFLGAYEPPRPRPQCRVADCGRNARARRLCGKHYQAWSKHGDPLVDLRSGGQWRLLAAG